LETHPDSDEAHGRGRPCSQNSASTTAGLRVTRMSRAGLALQTILHVFVSVISPLSVRNIPYVCLNYLSAKWPYPIILIDTLCQHMRALFLLWCFSATFNGFSSKFRVPAAVCDGSGMHSYTYVPDSKLMGELRDRPDYVLGPKEGSVQLNAYYFTCKNRNGKRNLLYKK